MGLFSKKSSEDKEFENKLKGLCGGFTNNDVFKDKLKKHGLSLNTPNLQYKNILKNEYSLGKITINNVEERLDELLSENLSTKELVNKNSELGMEKAKIKKQPKIESKVEEILKDKKVTIKIPQKMDAIQGAAIGALAMGKVGMTLGALTGGETTWRITKLLITDTGLTIKMNGQSITFDEIVNLEIVKPGDFQKPIFTITSKYGNNMIFSCEHKEALEIVLREKIPEADTVEDSNNNVDDLMKYAELFEKGLLTKEEFEAKKKELL